MPNPSNNQPSSPQSSAQSARSFDIAGQKPAPAIVDLKQAASKHQPVFRATVAPTPNTEISSPPAANTIPTATFPKPEPANSTLSNPHQVNPASNQPSQTQAPRSFYEEYQQYASHIKPQPAKTKEVPVIQKTVPQKTQVPIKNQAAQQSKASLPKAEDFAPPVRLNERRIIPSAPKTQEEIKPKSKSAVQNPESYSTVQTIPIKTPINRQTVPAGALSVSPVPPSSSAVIFKREQDRAKARQRIKALVTEPKKASFFEEYEKTLSKRTENQRNQAALAAIKRIQELEKKLEKANQKTDPIASQSAPSSIPAPLAPKPADNFFAPLPPAQKAPSFNISSYIPPRQSFFSRLKNRWARHLQSSQEILEEAFSPKIKKTLAYSFVATLALIILPVGLVAYRGLQEKSSIEKLGTAAYGSLQDAKDSMETANVDQAGKNFDLAYNNFLSAREKLDEVGGVTTRILDFVPGIKKIESGRRLAETGEHLSLAGKEITESLSFLLANKDELKNNFNLPTANAAEPNLTLLDTVNQLNDSLESAKEHLDQASQAAAGIDPKDFPKEEQNQITLLKESLPEMTSALEGFLKYNDVFLEILGANGSRKYLLLFENNQEMRPTGGFIGTYGVVKINAGYIENLEVDGIYNPDGQLKERIIPPKPVQKMSAAWSMHDANWWPDFPRSAKKISWFFEKTGGPSVDSVIALTPKVIVELLEIVGPLEVENYNSQTITIDADNFMDIVQEEVELNYDKEENRPKKILADLTPILLNKIFSASPEKYPAILDVLSRSLKERHISLYSFDPKIQELFSDMGWSGEVLDTNKDYLSVINTNISGFKTDGVIDQKISHEAQVQEDGSIVDTVTIERHHNGGDSQYEWHNAVNSDWMRVYVPEGSQLISATGFTREFVEPPLDYEKLDFKEDPDVAQMENSYQLDEASATRVYTENNKTVFANWTYVSPGETTTVTIKYLLPFRLDLKAAKKPADSYSLLVQKQAGDDRSTINLHLSGLDNLEYIYKYPQNLNTTQSGWQVEKELKEDFFTALVVKGKP